MNEEAGQPGHYDGGNRKSARRLTVLEVLLRLVKGLVGSDTVNHLAESITEDTERASECAASPRLRGPLNQLAELTGKS